METQVINATEHRDLPLSMLFESPSNPRRNFDENFLKGMAASMRVQGVLQRLLARPKEKRFEIVFGAQRYRAAQIAELPTIPVDIREMSDAEVLEAQLVELSIVVKRFLSVFAGLHVVDMSTTCGFAS